MRRIEFKVSFEKYEEIRKISKNMGLGIAPFIRMVVFQGMNNKNFSFDFENSLNRG